MEFVVWVSFLEREVFLESLDPVLEGWVFEELFFRNVVDECDWHVGIGESKGRHIYGGRWVQRGDELACDTLTSTKHLVSNIVEGLEPCDKGVVYLSGESVAVRAFGGGLIESHQNLP